MLSLSLSSACARTASRMAFRVRWVVSAPIRIRILSSPCHLPSRVSRAPISKYPVAMSNAFAMLDHSSKYRTPVQPETLLSTMKSSRPLGSTFMTLPFAPHAVGRRRADGACRDSGSSARRRRNTGRPVAPHPYPCSVGTSRRTCCGDFARKFGILPGSTIIETSESWSVGPPTR